MKRVAWIIGVLILAQRIGFAQKGQYGATPDDSIQCVTNYSLYTEFFKQNNFKDAIGPWRNTIKHCPGLSKSLYVNGEKMYAQKLKETTDAAVKETIIDTIMLIYDMRIKYFGEEGFVLGRKGSDLLKYREKDPKPAYEILQKSFSLQKQEMEPNATVFYFKSAYLLYKQNQIDKNTLINLYLELSGVCDAKVKTGNDNDKKNYSSALGNLDAFFMPVANCDDLIGAFTPRVKENPNDTSLLSKVANVLDKKNCTSSELFFQVASKMNEIKPSAESAYNLGLNQKEKNCGKAVDFFKQAYELATDDELKKKAAKQAALCYIGIGQFASTRSWAQKMLSINSNDGEAYIIIGSAYAASAGQCGDNKCSQKAAYWVAVDYFKKAKAVDSSVESAANEKIATYKKHYPSKEDCFFYNINEGTNFTVECWINETTKVRFTE